MSLLPGRASASGFGVFTQGASALGQANAVVAHTTGPSSLYFNPALINDVPGRQVELGTTAISTDRGLTLASNGDSVSAEKQWKFPSNLYYTHNTLDSLAAGIGIFFPFGLSSEWNENYEGRYLGTYAEMFSMNINPAVSYKVTDNLHLAAGLDFVYVDVDLRANINQTVVGGLLPPMLGGPISEPLTDVRQKLTGDGWGSGINLGALYKLSEHISIGAAYRSEVKVDLDASVRFGGVDPRLGLLFQDTPSTVELKLPAQFVAGVAMRPTDRLVIEIGCRWEDWASNDQLKAELKTPFLGQDSLLIPRDWRSTWAYNIGGQLALNDVVAINAGYLYGKNPVPDSTFEPIIPDSDTHLFTIGGELTFGQWTIDGAFGYQKQQDRRKSNSLGDPLGSMVAGMPVSTANGDYASELYLVGLSVGYQF